MRWTAMTAALAAATLVACSSAPPQPAPKDPPAHVARFVPKKAAPEPEVDDARAAQAKKAEAHRLAARAALESGDIPAARREAEAALALVPGDAAAIELRLTALERGGAPDDVVAEVRSELQRAESLALLTRRRAEVRQLLDTGAAMLDEGRVDNARQCAQKAGLLLRMSPMDTADDRDALQAEVDTLDKKARYLGSR